jgi:hypothetical protein
LPVFFRIIVVSRFIGGASMSSARSVSAGDMLSAWQVAQARSKTCRPPSS